MKSYIFFLKDYSFPVCGIFLDDVKNYEHTTIECKNSLRHIVQANVYYQSFHFIL